MNEKYFLCTLKWDAERKQEVVASKSKGYDNIQDLFKAAEPWIKSHLGVKFFIQKYHA